MRRLLLTAAVCLTACHDPEPIAVDAGVTDAGLELPAVPDPGPASDPGPEILIEPGPCADLAEGDPCDDGDVCTLGETCQGGFCVAAEVVECPAPEGACLRAVCDASLGCQEVTAPDGADCDVPCYERGQCLGGECLPVAGEEVQCPAPSDPCVDSIACDPDTNACSLLLYTLACPAGSVCQDDGGSLSCVPAFERLCRPCASHDECADPAMPSQLNACVDQGAPGSFCGGDCANLACPSGYQCVSAPGPLGDRPQCVPADGGLCACDPAWASMQLTTACHRENEHGLCDGQRGCAPGGLTECDAPVPGPEVCDGADNDCDGQVDEGLDCGQSGACCLKEGGCDVRFQQSCLLSGGVWQGAGLLCTEVACAGGEGACCRPDGSCTVQPLDVCSSIGGSYVGDGTLCTGAACQAQPDPAACCFFDGGCEFRAPLSCTSAGGSFAGKGTACNQPVCQGLGACCLPTLSCINTSKSACELQGGEHTGGVSCADKSCLLGEGYGACCLGAGACEVVTKSGCPGQFLVGEPCFGQCDVQGQGACCTLLGECTLVTAEECGGSSTFKGAGSTCPAACQAPKGTCCGPGQCHQFTEAQCDALPPGWTWLGEASCDECP